LFLLCFFYFACKWFENLGAWKKHGTLTLLFLAMCLLSHIYVGAVAVVMFVVLIVGSAILKLVKTKHIPTNEIKLVAILIGAGIVVVLVLKFAFPAAFTYFYDRIKGYLGGSTSAESPSISIASAGPPGGNGGPQEWQYFSAFLTIPFLLGLAVVIKDLYRAIRANRTDAPGTKKTGKPSQALPATLFTRLIYVALSVLLVALVLVPSTWQMRFSLLEFVPIALITPIGLKKIEHWVRIKHSTKLNAPRAVVAVLSILFIAGSFATVMAYVPGMGPTITTGQYDELVQISQNSSISIDPNGAIFVNNSQLPQWVEYILDRNTIPGSSVGTNLTGQQYAGIAVYELTLLKDVHGNFAGNFQPPWDPILPMSTSGKAATSSISAAGNPPPPPPTPTIPGKLLFHGVYFALSIVKFVNGTMA
jgi:hypothetical protein